MVLLSVGQSPDYAGFLGFDTLGGVLAGRGNDSVSVDCLTIAAAKVFTSRGFLLERLGMACGYHRNRSLSSPCSVVENTYTNVLGFISLHMGQFLSTRVPRGIPCAYRKTVDELHYANYTLSGT